MKNIPFVAFGNDELEPLPRVGLKATCPHCGERHVVQYGTDEKGKESKLLGFVDCGKKSYLVAVGGKELPAPKKPIRKNNVKKMTHMPTPISPDLRASFEQRYFEGKDNPNYNLKEAILSFSAEREEKARAEERKRLSAQLSKLPSYDGQSAALHYVDVHNMLLTPTSNQKEK